MTGVQTCGLPIWPGSSPRETLKSTFRGQLWRRPKRAAPYDSVSRTVIPRAYIEKILSSRGTGVSTARSASDRRSRNGRAECPASPSTNRLASSFAMCRCDDYVRRTRLPIRDDRPTPLPASVPTTPSSTRRSSRPWQITPADHAPPATDPATPRSEEHTSELQSLMRISYAVFCLKKKPNTHRSNDIYNTETHMIESEKSYTT